jgi:hypothetical protein
VFGIWADQAGTDWVMDWLQANRAGYSVIVLRSGAGTPALSLLDQIEAAELPLEKWSAADVSPRTAKCSTLCATGKYGTVRTPAWTWPPHQPLSRLQAGGGWIIDPKNSPSDTAPLTAPLWARCGGWGICRMTGQAFIRAPRAPMS